MISRQMMFSPTLLTAACTTLLLAACDSTSLTGAGAGDVDNSSVAVALLAPFTGYYTLQNDWSGISGDVAYLIIEAPGSDGISPVALYDFDDFSNCLPERPSTGEAYKDLLSDRIFMDGIFLFNEAVLSFTDTTLTTLTITFNNDADLNNDGNVLDRVSVTATRLGISLVSDLGDTCI